MTELDQQLCYLKGEFLPLGEARIHPLDRGFNFGDGVYEVVKILDGVALFLDGHLERLAAGLEEVRIPQPPALGNAALELLRRSGVHEGSLFLQVTRGVAARVHVPPADLEPTLFMLAAPHAFAAPGSLGMEALSRPDWRWRRCDIKSTSLMATVLGKLELRGTRASEVLFTGPDGEIREGGSTNVFVRRDDAWETHPLGDQVLPGITRGLVLQLAQAAGQPIRDRAPRLAERDSWQEMLVCGTLTGIQGIVRLDGRAVADGEVGPWTARLATGLQELERRQVRDAAASLAKG